MVRQQLKAPVRETDGVFGLRLSEACRSSRFRALATGGRGAGPRPRFAVQKDLLD